MREGPGTGLRLPALALGRPGTGGRRRAIGALLAGLAVVACSATPAPRAPRAAVPSATAGTVSGDRAAGLRAQLDLLLGEHVLLLARTGVAAAGARNDELTGYGTVLHQNSGAIASALGQVAQSQQVAQQASQALQVFDGAAGDYMTAASRNDLAGENAAMTTLTTAYVGQMSAVLTQLTGLSREQLVQLLNQQVLSARSVFDAEARGGDWNGVFAAVRASYDQARMTGDQLTKVMTDRARSRFPGDSTSKGATLAVALEMGLQEEAHLLAMAASAAAGKRQDELDAARASLQSSQTELGEALAAIGPDAPARAMRILGDVAGAFIGDAVAVADGDVTGRQLAEARLTTGFATAAGRLGKEAGLTQTKALAMARAVGQALMEAAEAEGGRNYQTAPFAVRDAATAGATMAGALAAAIVKAHPRQYT